LDESQEEWNVAVRQATNMARRPVGRLPGFLEEVLSEINKPTNNWRETLRPWIDNSSTKDYTWTKPNRRMLPFDIVSPGIISDGLPHLGVVIDSSGSIDTGMLKQFGGEVQSALDDGAVDKVTVMFCDDGVQSVKEYGKSEIIDLTVKGRGGTRFSPAFKWFEENAPDVSGVVYFSDLDCSDFGPEPSFRVLWAAHEQPQYVRQLRTRMMNVPFGDCIELMQ
jgi:predicted metal-dependent peptidase